MNLQNKCSIDVFGGVVAFFCRCPSQDVLLLTVDHGNLRDYIICWLFKDSREKIKVPGTGIWNPKIGDHTRQRILGDWKLKVIVDGFLDWALGRGPDGGIAIVNLIGGILDQVLFDLKDRQPEEGTRAVRLGLPKGGGMEVFSFDNTGKKRIFSSSNFPSGVSNQTFIHIVEIPDSKATIVLGLADVIPRTESNRISGIIILNTSP